MKAKNLVFVIAAFVIHAGLARAQDPTDPTDTTDTTDTTQTDALATVGDIEAATTLDLTGVDAVEAIVDDETLGPSGEPNDDIDPGDVEATLFVDNRLRSAAARQPRRVMELMTSLSPKQRASAARSIGTERNLLGIGPLVTALADRDATVRKAAADSLAKIGSFEALGALHVALPREQTPATSRAMDKAIGAIEDRVFAGPGGRRAGHADLPFLR